MTLQGKELHFLGDKKSLPKVKKASHKSPPKHRKEDNPALKAAILPLLNAKLPQPQLNQAAKHTKKNPIASMPPQDSPTQTTQ